MGKIRGCAFALFFTSAAHACVFLTRGLIQLVAWVLYFFGLWAPIAYAAFGGLLYLFLQFDPFGFDLLSLIYLVGFGLSLLLASFLAFRHLIGDPWRNMIASLKRFTSAETETEEKRPAQKKPRKKAVAAPVAPAPAAHTPPPESPSVYLSAVEPDTLIHEYRDRFEVYKVSGGKSTLRKVEYKDGEI